LSASETASLPPNAAEGGRARRQSELALAAWEQKFANLGRSPTLAELFAEIDTEEWSYGFVLAVDPQIDASSLLDYGANFARLLELPPKPRPFVRITRQLPTRYADIFLRGCTAADKKSAPVHAEGEVTREDGRRELYRAVFIPVQPDPDIQTRFAFGRFNSRVVEA